MTLGDAHALARLGTRCLWGPWSHMPGPSIALNCVLNPSGQYSDRVRSQKQGGGTQWDLPWRPDSPQSRPQLSSTCTGSPSPQPLARDRAAGLMAPARTPYPPGQGQGAKDRIWASG